MKKIIIPSLLVLAFVAGHFTPEFNVGSEAQAQGSDFVYTLTIPAANIPELINVYGRDYEPVIVDLSTFSSSTNPQSKPQYALQKFDERVKRMIRNDVIRYRKETASDAVSTEFGVTSNQ